MTKFYKMLTCAVLALSMGCSTITHKIAVYAENGLYAGAQGWSTDVVDPAVAECRDEYQDGLQEGLSEADLRQAWETCIAPIRDANEETEKWAQIAVAALQAYWIAAAANDREGMIKALKDLKVAINHLPDSHFGGLKKILKRF